MPGGCYVEGVRLETAAWWKPSVGPFWERPGHYNSVWNYWSTDGIILFSLCEVMLILTHNHFKHDIIAYVVKQSV